jgi:hypothetical protein
LHGFIEHRDVRQHRYAQFVFDPPHPLQGPISLSPPAAIQGHQAGSGFHNLLSGFEGGRNRNLSLVLFGFSDSDDGNANRLPNRRDILWAIRADSGRPALHSARAKRAIARGSRNALPSSAWQDTIRGPLSSDSNLLGHFIQSLYPVRKHANNGLP